MENIRICYLNAQSLRGKDILLHQYLQSAQMDLGIFVETWLDDTRDVVRQQATDLAKDGFKCEFVNRSGPGGGIALVYKDSLDVTAIVDVTPVTFEKATWKIQSGGKHATVTVVYRPPGRPGMGISKFQDEFLSGILCSSPKKPTSPWRLQHTCKRLG